MEHDALAKIMEEVNGFTPISLADMYSVKLMDRTDTKFLVPLERLPSLLSNACGHYRVLEIGGKRLMSYETLYYDTADLALYHKHHAGHLNRYKVRMRKYVDSDASFFEVKFKDNRGRTIKSRIETKPGELDRLDETSQSFLTEHTPLNPADLRPVLWANYRRVTLVNVQSRERVTVDLGLSFVLGQECRGHPLVAIVEIKRGKERAPSAFTTLMREQRLKAGGISKYCLGVASLCKQAKTNRLKPAVRRLRKIGCPPRLTESTI